MSINARTVLALSGLAASVLSLSGAAQAQGLSLVNRCDRLCADNPRAICYQACFNGGGVSYHAPKPKQPRPQPVSVQGDWRQAVYNSTFSGRGGTGGNGGGGGGGKGK